LTGSLRIHLQTDGQSDENIISANSVRPLGGDNKSCDFGRVCGRSTDRRFSTYLTWVTCGERTSCWSTAVSTATQTLSLYVLSHANFELTTPSSPSTGRTGTSLFLTFSTLELQSQNQELNSGSSVWYLTARIFCSDMTSAYFLDHLSPAAQHKHHIYAVLSKTKQSTTTVAIGDNRASYIEPIPYTENANFMNFKIS